MYVETRISNEPRLLFEQIFLFTVTLADPCNWANSSFSDNDISWSFSLNWSAFQYNDLSWSLYQWQWFELIPVLQIIPDWLLVILVDPSAWADQLFKTAIWADISPWADLSVSDSDFSRSLSLSWSAFQYSDFSSSLCQEQWFELISLFEQIFLFVTVTWADPGQCFSDSDLNGSLFSDSDFSRFLYLKKSLFFLMVTYVDPSRWADFSFSDSDLSWSLSVTVILHLHSSDSLSLWQGLIPLLCNSLSCLFSANRWWTSVWTEQWDPEQKKMFTTLWSIDH